MFGLKPISKVKKNNKVIPLHSIYFNKKNETRENIKKAHYIKIASSFFAGSKCFCFSMNFKTQTSEKIALICKYWPHGRPNSSL